MIYNWVHGKVVQSLKIRYDRHQDMICNGKASDFLLSWQWLNCKSVSSYIYSRIQTSFRFRDGENQKSSPSIAAVSNHRLDGRYGVVLYLLEPFTFHFSSHFYLPDYKGTDTSHVNSDDDFVYSSI